MKWCHSTCDYTLLPSLIRFIHTLFEIHTVCFLTQFSFKISPARGLSFTASRTKSTLGQSDLTLNSISNRGPSSKLSQNYPVFSDSVLKYLKCPCLGLRDSTLLSDVSVCASIKQNVKFKVYSCCLSFHPELIIIFFIIDRSHSQFY